MTVNQSKMTVIIYLVTLQNFPNAKPNYKPPLVWKVYNFPYEFENLTPSVEQFRPLKC
jgi:hypothetical protein